VTTETINNVSAALGRAWHAVAKAAEVDDRPHQVWLLGKAWALVRLESGLVAFEDRCPHRLAPLSLGKVIDDELQCGYHGWRFNAQGRCTAIPAIGATDRIPNRANAQQPWGIQERYGLVWLAPDPPRCDIHDFPEWEADGFDQIWSSVVRTNAGAAQLVDNFLDASHFPFVHTQTFGDNKATMVVDDGIAREGWFVRTSFSTWYRNFDDPLVATGEHDAVQPQELLKQGSASLSVYLRLYFPVTDATFAILFCCQPETATSTRIYKLMARNDLNGDRERIAATIKDEDLVLEEDLAVLERFFHTDLPLDQRVEVHTKADRLSIGWRRLLAEWFDSDR
jgi:phenylpropionate dioxygenase-like ring-hydroxylating dioxygenase large terminal subunit